MAHEYALQTVQAHMLEDRAGFSSLLQRSATLTGCPMYSRTTVVRRGVFLWLKLFVHNRSEDTTVMIRVPLPVPLIGLLFRRRFSTSQAVDVASLLEGRSPDDPGVWLAVQRYVASLCGVEFLRVNSKDASIVLGLE